MAIMLDLVWLLPLLPLLGFLLNLLLIRNERLAGYLASTAVGAAFVVALLCFGALLGWPQDKPYPDFVLWTWFNTGSFVVPFGLLFDPLSAVMTLLITGVGTLIHVYSIGYMRGDERAVRYFAYLNLFVVMMLLLVLADNFLLLFLGWEGVGLCSFLLIGHWFERRTASEAAVKAFVVNRIGDAALLLAMFIIFATFGTLTFYTQTVGGTAVAGVFDRVDEIAGRTVPIGLLGPWLLPTAIAVLMLVAVTGKSAQIPLFGWLPDAMAGPTPVSALIHAATMVTAGVYLIVRSHGLFELSPSGQNLTIWVGALTALVGGLAALAQWDIKRVLAYSTVSQLGFMVVAAGMGAYSAAMFHLLAHGMFKALLFLAAGSVIHGTHDTQDMRKMGGLRQAMPWTYRAYLVGALALAGIFPLAGFWSKDAILAHALFDGQRTAVFAVLFLSSLLTALYMGRQVALVFFGRRRDTSYQPHESSGVMLVPLFVLALGAIVGGLINAPVIEPLSNLLQPLLAEAPTTFGLREGLLATITTLLSAAVGYSGFRFYLGQSGKVKAGAKDPLYPYTGDLWDLSAEALGFNALGRYTRQGYEWVAGRVAAFDTEGLDGLVESIPRGLGALGNSLRGAQSGYVRTYALLFLVGVVLMVAYFLLLGGQGLAVGIR